MITFLLNIILSWTYFNRIFYQQIKNSEICYYFFKASKVQKKGENVDQPEIFQKSQIRRAETLKFWKQI